MAGLYDRITQDTTRPEFPNHAFASALRLLALGAPLITKATIVNRFNLNAAEEADLDAMRTQYANRPANAKRDYISIIMDANTLADDGFLTETQWKTIVGI